MDLKTILIKEPIFKKYKHSDFTFEEQMNLFFHFKDEKMIKLDFLDSYCPICKTETIFSAIETNNRQEFSNILLGQVNFSNKKKTFVDYFNDIGIFKREFSCSRNKSNDHNLIIIFRVINDRFYKICQDPPLSDLSYPNLEKYRKFNNEIYKELNRAIGLASHGIGVAPFVYLRRILEKHIINPIIQEKIQEDNSNQFLIKLDFRSKINELKDFLPSFLTNNSKIYSILSKGIHELEEDECLNIFPILLNSVELILNEQIEKVEKLKKEAEISKLLNNI